MTNKKLLIIYFAETGNTKKMAEEIGHGANRLGVQVELKRVEDCSLDQLVEADGIIIGSPTYFSNVTWQVKKLIDDSIVQYRKNHQLKDKIGGCSTAAGSHRDGKDCIRMLELAFGLHHRLKMIPGIIGASDDSEEEVAKMCQQYGAKIAHQFTE